MTFQIYNQNHPQSFRMAPKEICATSFLRCKMGMSINHIAEILGRSTASVHLSLRKNNMVGIIDNRGKPQVQHQNRIAAYALRRDRIAAALRVWMDGKAETFREALTMTIKGFGRVPGQEITATAQQRTASGQGIQDSGSSQEVHEAGENIMKDANENSSEGEEEEPA